MRSLTEDGRRGSEASGPANLGDGLSMDVGPGEGSSRECHGLAGVRVVTHEGDNVAIETQGIERIAGVDGE